MANGWIKAFTTKYSALYVGGGIGSCRGEYDIPLGSGLESSESDSSFAYQFGIWNSIPFGENGSFDLGYRYLATQFDPDIDIGAHIIGLRIRRNF